MIQVKLLKGIRIGGIRVLSGAVLGFDSHGQARAYTEKGIAELVDSKPKAKRRAKSSKGDAIDDTYDGGSHSTTADTGTGKE